MGKKADISVVKKHAVFALLKTKKMSVREIAKLENVSHSFVVNLSKQIRQNDGIPPSKRSLCGRHRKTSTRVDRKIISVALANRKASVKNLKQILLQDGIDVSQRTLERRFKEAQLRCKKPIRKPRLNQRMRQARLKFAKDHRHFTLDDWQQVSDLFTAKSS